MAPPLVTKPGPGLTPALAPPAPSAGRRDAISFTEEQLPAQPVLSCDLSGIGVTSAPSYQRLITEAASHPDLSQDKWEVPNVSSNLRQCWEFFMRKGQRSHMAALTRPELLGDCIPPSEIPTEAFLFPGLTRKWVPGELPRGLRSRGAFVGVGGVD